jgi:hypothetical protein
MSSRPSWGPLKSDVGLHPDELDRELAPDGATRVEDRAAGSDDLEDLGVTVFGKEKWRLPGQGEAGDECGKLVPSGVCDECGHVVAVEHACGSKQCPECSHHWLKQRAAKAAAIVQIRRMAERGRFRQLGSFVWSPDDVPQSIRGMKEMRKEAWEKGREKGLRGAVVVAHAARLTREAIKLYTHEGGADSPLGKWAWLREHYEDRMTFEADDPLIYWSPHCHLIGLMSPNMEAGSDEDNGVWKLVEDGTFDRLEGVDDFSSHQDVWSAIRYLLSHAAVHADERFAALTYYGAFNKTSSAWRSPGERTAQETKEAVEEAVEVLLDPDRDSDGAGGGDADEEREECPCDGCDGAVIPVEGISDYLRNSEPPGGDHVIWVMKVVRDLRYDSEYELPAGYRNPRSSEDLNAGIEKLAEERNPF